MRGAPDRPIYVDGNSCRERREHGPDRAIGTLGEAQHGFVARWQLIALGLAPDGIDYRVKIGRLHPYHRGVYSVGHRKVTKEGRWMAAVLAGGEGAVLSHRSAAELWRLREGARVPVEITVPRARRPQRGIQFHRSPLPFDEVTIHDGIATTTVPRTLFDLATVLDPRQVERALNEAEMLRLWDHLSLRDLLHRYPRREGSRAIRAALERREEGATVTKSELEEMFVEFLDEVGLPRPEINATVRAGDRLFEPDCLWRKSGLIVELDSRRVHATAEAFESDRERDRRLDVAGFRTIRITFRTLAHQREQLNDDLTRLLARTPL
jgi:hypothetical protein